MNTSTNKRPSLTVVDDEFYVCVDCIMVIANGDYSGLDYQFGNDEDAIEARIAEIDAGIENAGGFICAGDSERDESFSSRDCDCCGSRLAGSRYHCVLFETS